MSALSSVDCWEFYLMGVARWPNFAGNAPPLQTHCRDSYETALNGSPGAPKEWRLPLSSSLRSRNHAREEVLRAAIPVNPDGNGNRR